MDKMPVIKKPKDSQGFNTTDWVSVVGEIVEEETKDGYEPSFVVGVSFGVDLSKWREILNEIFNSHTKHTMQNGFNELKKFDKAVLITDPVFVRDRHGMDVLQADTLTVWLRGTSSSYLHTKMVLIALEKVGAESTEKSNKYVLLVGSKNITYSKNFDLLMPLYSTTQNGGSGEEVLKYLNFLAKTDEKKNIINDYLSGLKTVCFDVKNDEDEYEGHITDFAFLYDNHRDFEAMWTEIEQSDLVISPYLTEEEFRKWCNSEGTTKEKNTKPQKTIKKILTYWNSANKVCAVQSNEDSPEKNNKNTPTIDVYVGKTYDDGRYKFHAKMYVSKMGENGAGYTKLWIGSANLTKEAREVHCEFLMGISFKDDGTVYEYIKKQILTPNKNTNKNSNFNNSLIEEYALNSKGEIPDIDDEVENSNVGRMQKYALFSINKKYEWRTYALGDKEASAIYIVSSEEISNWIKMGEEGDIFVCEDNYCSDAEIKNQEGYMSYGDYKTVVSNNVKKKRGKYYREIFLRSNSVGRKGQKEKKKQGKGTKQYIQYPCLYKRMMEINANKKGIEIEKELSKLYTVFMDDQDDNEIVKLMGEYVSKKKEGGEMIE